MQTPIYDRFDLFLTNVSKQDIYSMRQGEEQPIEMEHVANTEIGNGAKIIGTQSHVESTIIDVYRANKEYLKRKVKILVYKGDQYLIDGHHTYIAWVLDGAKISLEVEIYRFKRKTMLAI